MTGLQKVKKSGKYDDLYQKYFVDTLENSEDVTDVAANRWFSGTFKLLFSFRITAGSFILTVLELH